MAGGTTPLRRSAVPWLVGLAALLAVLSPLLFSAVWVGGAGGLGVALLAAVADLVAAVIAAGVARSCSRSAGCAGCAPSCSVIPTAAWVGCRRTARPAGPSPATGSPPCSGSTRAWSPTRGRWRPGPRSSTSRCPRPAASSRPSPTPRTSPPPPSPRTRGVARSSSWPSTGPWPRGRRRAAPRRPSPAGDVEPAVRAEPGPRRRLPPDARPGYATAFPRRGGPRRVRLAVADAVRQAAARGVRDLRDRHARLTAGRALHDVTYATSVERIRLRVRVVRTPLPGRARQGPGPVEGPSVHGSWGASVHRTRPGVSLSGREPRAIPLFGGVRRAGGSQTTRRAPTAFFSIFDSGVYLTSSPLFGASMTLPLPTYMHDVADRAVEEDQVAGLQVVHGDLLADLGLRGRGARQVLAGLVERELHEAGAVERVRAGRAPDVGLAELGLGGLDRLGGGGRGLVDGGLRGRLGRRGLARGGGDRLVLRGLGRRTRPGRPA